MCIWQEKGAVVIPRSFRCCWLTFRRVEIRAVLTRQGVNTSQQTQTMHSFSDRGNDDGRPNPKLKLDSRFAICVNIRLQIVEHKDFVQKHVKQTLRLVLCTKRDYFYGSSDVNSVSSSPLFRHVSIHPWIYLPLPRQNQQTSFLAAVGKENEGLVFHPWPRSGSMFARKPPRCRRNTASRIKRRE